MKRADIISAALSLQEVRYQHAGWTREGGVDCIGVIVVAAREAGASGVPDSWSGYSENPNPAEFVDSMRRYMDEIDPAEVRDGDVPYMWWDRHSKVPQHVGILVPGDRIVHAYREAGKVVVSPMGKQWRRRIVHAFRVRGLED